VPPGLSQDEPTIGLDVVAQQPIRDFLRRMNQGRGLTVLLTTHDMTDIVQLCPRMLLIDHGRLLYDGAVAAIRDRFGVERTVVVDLAEDETLGAPFGLSGGHFIRATKCPYVEGCCGGGRYGARRTCKPVINRK
jgi:viologen exporter family transport system ATP-binding protein